MGGQTLIEIPLSATRLRRGRWVFIIRRGPADEVWVNTLFDVGGHHLHYVYFMADLLVTTVDVRFKPIDASSTQVNVVFTRTALTPARANV